MAFLQWIDSSDSTSHFSLRDVNIYPQNSGSSRQSQPPRQVNDAPTYLLSSHFTGREKELKHIERIFGVVHGGEPTRCVMYGMFGLGKTQLALKYATMSYRRNRYSLVFWISGATVEKLNQGLAKVLDLIDHPDHGHVEQSTKLTSVRRWFEEGSAIHPTRWLLVIDNVTQEALTFLKEHLPRNNSMGNILLTTRTKAVAEGVVSVAGQQHQFFELMAPDIDDAVELLLKEAGINPNQRIASASCKAKDLVECLGRLPLAISQAASFAKQSHKNLDYVLGLYRSRHRYQLMSWENDLSNYEQKSVAVAFTTLFQKLERQYPDSSNLLKVLSFLDPEHIPLKMINDGADKLQPQSPSEPSPLDITSHEPRFRQSLLHRFRTRWHRRRKQPMGLSIITPQLESLIALIGAPVQLQSAIQQLLHSSLVTSTDISEPNTDTSALRIHDLIKLMIQESVRGDNKHYPWFHVAAALVCGAFQRIEDPTSHRWWAQCETLNPHIHSLTMWDDANEVGNWELHQANIGIAEYFSSRGRYGEAEVLFRRALTRNEKLCGPKHPDTLCAAESLAITCYLQGQHHEAKVLQLRVLASRERALGPEHADTLVAVDNLAITFYLQGQYKEAERLQRRVLASREKILGPEHPDTFGTMNNLALTCQSQLRYEEAEKLYKKALEGNERQFGPENLDVLDTIDNLAIIYRLQQRYREAEELFRRVMESRETLLGREHPDALGTVNNLAIVYLQQKRYEEAEDLYKRALAGNENLLGPNNPDTLGTVHNLALTYDSQGRRSEAEKLYKRALKGREEVLGPQHPDTVHTVRALADFFRRHNQHRDRDHLKNHFPLAFTSR